MIYDSRNRKRTKSNYYYFTTHKYAISNILNSRIKISNYKSINDIHELLSIKFTSKDKKAINAIEYYKNNIGFISFSKYWDSPLMWGLYSENNKGICLGFELNYGMSDTEYFSRKKSLSEFSNYDPISDKTPISIIKGIVNTKSNDWVYEQESRLFEDLKIKDIETGFYFKEFNKNIILKEIIIGTKSDFNPIDVKHFLNKIKYNGEVVIFKTKPSKKYYLLEKDENYQEESYSNINPII